MADTPTDPNLVSQMAQATGQTEAQVEALLKAEKAARANTVAQQDLTTASQDYGSVLNTLQSKLNQYGVTLEKMGPLIGQQSVAFGLLSAGIVNTTQKFMTFHDNLDVNRLGNFTDQYQNLINVVNNMGPGLAITTDAGKELINALSSMGIGGKAFSEIISYTGPKLAQFAKNITTGADNTLRFQSMITQATSQAGNMKELYDGLGDSFQGVGNHMENLNNATQQLMEIQTHAATAVLKNSSEVAQYNAILAKTPGGLEAMVKGVDFAGKHVDALTAIYQLAQGAGLDMAQTFQDVKDRVLETGMSIQGSNNFMTRFVDISKNLHIPMEDVRKSLLDASSSFKFWNTGGEQSIKMNQGLADSVENYTKALKNVGVPARLAVEMATSYTKQLGNLGEAQESFISQMSGGSGGIRGALEFEQLLETDPAAAQKKAMDTMKQTMGGKIITREEALRTGQEDQYVKQRMMLTQGTLGIKAGSNAEADKMIKAMAQGIEYKASDKGLKGAQADLMERAEAEEKLSFTGVKEASMTAEQVMLTAGTINLGTLQKAFAAGTGESSMGQNIAGQKILSARQDRAREFSGGHTPMIDAFKNVAGTITNAGTLMSTGFSSLKESVVGRTAPTQQQQQSELQSQVDAVRQSRSTAATLASKMTKQQMDDYLSSGKQVASVVPTTTTSIPQVHARTGGLATASGTHATGPIPVTIAGGSITVNHTGVCPHCRSPLTASSQSQVTSIASTQ